MFGRFTIKLDKTGFPLIKRFDWDFYSSLLPVSKYQFEKFMVEHGAYRNLYTNAWYSQKLEKNPRASWKSWGNEPWKLFITGLFPDEIKPFLKFLGKKQFRLPKRSEWILLHRSESDIKDWIRENMEQIVENKYIAKPAIFWIKKGLYPLVKEGLCEIIEDGKFEDGFVDCIGKPWQGLWQNTFNAVKVKKVDFKLVSYVIGFRIVVEQKLEEIIY